MAYLQNGYLCVYNGHGRIREGGGTHYPLHRLLYEQFHGVVLSSDFIVHHRNDDKLDNRIENLEAVTRSEHPRRHATRTRPGERRCGHCGEWKPSEAFSVGQKRCKTCARETHSAWVADHPERVAEYNRRRRERHAAKRSLAA